MQDTLYEGQRLIESKIPYYYSEPKRGDIVIINSELEKGAFKVFVANTKELIESFNKNEEEDNKRLIKRVIGVPGDTIDIKDGKVYINGELYEEAYVKGETYPNSMEFPIIIPEKEYFVMGDNRENSMDSRDIGLISIDKIEGKAVIRLWPLDKFGEISN
jgi:signal peptidase I